MDDVSAFDRQIASEVLLGAGPSEPVDDLTIFDAVTAASRSHGWGFTMFSALKFVVAAAIVALFGGFLLAGVFSTQQGDEVLPAAVTESPEPEAATAPPEATTAPTEPGEPVVRTDILPGVTLTAKEVEPGVYRVVDDGLRDLAKANNLDIVAGHDGGVWLLRPQRFFRLGGDEWHRWASEQPDLYDFEVAPDGTVWTVDRRFIRSSDGEGWTTHHAASPGNEQAMSIELTPDGTVWAFWVDPEQENPQVFGYLDGDGWQALGQLDAHSLHVASANDIWATGGWDGWPPSYLYRFTDGAWQTATTTVRHPNRQELGDLPAEAAEPLRLTVGVGPDGTLWGVGTRGNDVARFDGSGWSRWSVPRETGWLWYVDSTEGGLEVGPDGSVWFVSRWGPLGPDLCGGVGHADGDTWDSYPRYLEDLCVDAIDITDDGSVWVLAGKGSQEEEDAGPRRVYVITPEAVAAAE